MLIDTKTGPTQIGGGSEEVQGGSAAGEEIHSTTLGICSLWDVRAERPSGGYLLIVPSTPDAGGDQDGVGNGNPKGLQLEQELLCREKPAAIPTGQLSLSEVGGEVSGRHGGTSGGQVFEVFDPDYPAVPDVGHGVPREELWVGRVEERLGLEFGPIFGGCFHLKTGFLGDIPGENNPVPLGAMDEGGHGPSGVSEGRTI